MENVPLFSVIMPFYRHGKYVEQAVDSILRQSCPDWELLIVVDGGKFNFSWEDKRIEVWQSSDHIGQSACRNVGLNNIKGKFIVFLDADDTMLQDRFNLEKCGIKQDQELWSYGSYKTLGNNKKLKQWQAHEFNQAILKKRNFIGIGTVTIPWSIIEQYRFNENLRYGEDWELWWRISKTYQPIYMPYNFYYKRLGTSRWGKIRGLQWHKRRKVRKLLI